MYPWLYGGVLVKEVSPGLYVGDLQDCRDSTYYTHGVVHACKYPCWNTNTSLGKLACQLGRDLYLNMIDPPKNFPAEFGDPMFTAAVQFIHKQVGEGHRVLIHCNQGHSRSPSLVLVYLARLGRTLNNEFTSAHNFVAARAEFKALYPAYRPSGGIRTYLRDNWESLMEIPL